MLRALRWVCLNDLPGNEFIRVGSSKAVVTLELRHRKQTFILKRKKGKALNTYSLNGQVFKSFLTSVPDPIKALLRVSPINFQGQHDTPFWFNETAGEVSRQLNAVIDLGVIDSALGKAGGIVRQAMEREAICRERLKEIKEKQAVAEAGREQVDNFRALQVQHDQVNKRRKRADKLESLVQSAGECAHTIHTGCERLLELRNVVARASALRAAQQYATTLSNLVELAGNYGTAQRIAVPKFDLVERCWKEYARIYSESENLQALLGEIEIRIRETARRRLAAENSHMQIEKLNQERICPLCQRPNPKS